ncbi:RNA polymerase sigma-70 factor, ECF subfamily [Thermoanaerobacter uzonensis DSM 18761]|uniref:RNA polymerase sigma-70 factor, ECF subfamily n=1 Tax=Thermoanaerobacter uzonensis DSM 18761 TaxID=1123369 RepID=A0A1M4X1B4_9THEO|nr:sigma-70 family RNA polymerase sigma factor [Thermoanaerobacter uzonensis]SHE87240.1 RNA polymerase sigma-70 factor, ECF subfamily [Thermoanaerobacter uzonensis DSM 18761]
MWQDLYKAAFYNLLKLGVPQADAEDIAQEALLSTYLNLDGIQEGKLKAYVLTAARNKYTDFLRKTKKDVTVSIIDAFPQSTFSEFQQFENKEVIKKAVNRLTLNEQKLFYLKFILEMSNEEISSYLKTNSNTVKTMVWRLRKKLKEYLKEEEKS